MANNFTKTLDMINIVGLRESINDLYSKESKYVPVASLCKSYLKKLDEGAHEEELVYSFCDELSKVAVHDSSKDALFNLNKRIEESKRDISLANTLYEMKKGQYNYVVPMIESSIVEYMVNKTPETRTSARQTLSLFEGIKEVNEILESLSYDEYDEKTKSLHNQTIGESFIPKEKTYTEAEVEQLVAEAKSEVANEVPTHKSISDIDTHINLDATIKNILKNSTNEGLKAFCEQYISALNAGRAEEVLYESFISGLSRWNYLSAVDTEASALKDRISKYQQDIDLKKILKIMEGTGSYYIVPLIEGVVADYVANKTMTNKAILKQRLQAFEYDPFVRDILNAVMLDQSLANTVYLGESVEQLNNYVHTEKVFSPVKYIKENECIFNVKGTYYTRKGNTVTKVSKENVEKLDESFKTLCNLVNHPAVKIDDLANIISIYEGEDSAKISETSIIINGEEVTPTELKQRAENSHLMNEHKEGFFAAINMINENFDKIAYIDFVKRIAMNESNGKSVDVFRIKNNIFVNTTDLALGNSTFYRNVNPIQCRSYINEHMQINVAPLFEDILPNQHAILEGIEDTKKEYEAYLDELNSKKEQFEQMKDSSDDTKDIDDAIKIIEDEIKEVEKKYDDFKKKSEEYVDGSDSDVESRSADDVAKTDAEDSDDTPAETEDDMKEPLGADASVDSTAEDVFADPDQEAIDSATPYDADFDVAVGTDNSKAEVKVLRISYAENVKSGKKSNKGTAYIVIPSVDANGDIKDETKSVTFYLDQDRRPIINNDYMPLMVYNSIVNAIAEDPDTAAIDVDTVDDIPTEDTPVEDAPVVSAEATVSTDVTTPASTDIPSPEDEPMFGVDNGEDSLGDIPSTEDSSIDASIDSTSTIDSLPAVDSSIDDENLGTDEDIPAGDYVDFDNTDSNIDASIDSTEDSSVEDTTTDLGDDTPVDAAPQESPAETEARSEEESDYPIELGLNINDIKPITKESFCKACDEMCVECAMVEGEDDSVTLKFANKAAVYALKDYFKEWKNFSDSQFITFFPELKKCFENKPKVPVAPQVAESASIKILDVNAINESALYNDSKNGGVRIVLPYSDDYAKLFDQPKKKGVSHIEIITESYDETKDVYNKLYTYSAAVGDKLDEDAKNFLDRYAKDFSEISESNVFSLEVPYNGFLEQKLSSKGIPVSVNESVMTIAVDKDNIKKAKRIFESFYSKNVPTEVQDFFQLSESSLNEGVIITVEDTKTGKTVKIDTSDLDSKDSSDESTKEEADPFKDSLTTFDTNDSALFKSDDEDSDDKKDDEDSKDDKKVEENVDEKSDNDKSSEDEPKKEEPKKKFKFRPKKKTDESVNTPSTEDTKPLNESENAESAPAPVKQAAPNVLDWVDIGNGQVGQIIASLPMSGNFIVNVSGRTIEVSPKVVKAIKPRPDTVEAPYKFDPKTLKGLFEQMVHAGIFMYGNQMTPNNCFVKYSEFTNAGPEDDVRLIIESEQVFAKKKYIKVLEEINDFANVNNYVEGVEIAEDGSELRNILFNIVDYQNAIGTADPVRALIDDLNGEKSLISLPAGAIKPVEM